MIYYHQTVLPPMYTFRKVVIVEHVLHHVTSTDHPLRLQASNSPVCLPSPQPDLVNAPRCSFASFHTGVISVHIVSEENGGIPPID
jgi:hypothetical protein